MRIRGIATVFGVLGLCLLGQASAASPAPLLGKYVRYDAGEYVIVSSRGEPQARRIVEDLAKFRATLEHMLNKRATRNTATTTIVVNSTADWDRWFRPLEGVTGYFRPGSFSNYMALNGDTSVDETLQVVFHEFTHYFLATRFAGEYPPWFNEGLAELMAYARFDKGVALLGNPAGRLNDLRKGEWIPFERLIRVDHDSPEYQTHRLLPSFYAQAWLTVHYGMVEDAEFRGQMLRYLADLNTLMPQEDAARKAFGDLAAVDRKLREYAKSARMNRGAITIGEIAPVNVPRGQPLSDVDAMATVADLLLDSDAPRDRVMPLIQELDRSDSSKARPAILQARLAQRGRDNDAFDSAVAQAEASLGQGEWLQRRELGYLLLTNGLVAGQMGSNRGDAAIANDVSRAKKLFADAVAYNKEDVQSLWGYGAAAVFLGKDLDQAEASLLAAYERAPTNADIAVSLANLKGRQHDPDGMIPYLEDAARFANDLQVRRWATETLIETEKFIAERDEDKKK